MAKANQETEIIRLWLFQSNREMYDFFINLAKRTQDKVVIVDAIRGYLEAENPVQGDNSIFADLIANALSNINYDVLADEFMEDSAS